jgi:hypothetical protein
VGHVCTTAGGQELKTSAIRFGHDKFYHSDIQRRVLERYMNNAAPISLIMAVADHPWTKASRDTAAVRIAMTVATSGSTLGQLLSVVAESGLDTDEPRVEIEETIGKINADLTIGTNLTSARTLESNRNVAFRGITFLGAGFVVGAREIEHFTAMIQGESSILRPYLSGRDLVSRSRGVHIIDLYGKNLDEVRHRYPKVYQHLLATVKPVREKDNRESYRKYWWLFAEPRREFRDSANGLKRYIAISQTAKHLIFQFVDAASLPDQTLVVIASDDELILGILSSAFHRTWALAMGGTLEDRPRYTNSLCFDTFPFPTGNFANADRIRAIAEDLDAHRKRVLADHAHLTLTGLYNVLEKLRAGEKPAALAGDDRRIFDDGLVLILKELHDRLDAAVADAYGWPADLADNDNLARLVALNKERAQEEARGIVRWLRPDYQIPRFGTAAQKAELDLVGGAEAATAAGPKPLFPADDMAQTAAVMAALANAAAPLDAASLASHFRQGRRAGPKIASVLGALLRMGFVASPDGGGKFSLRRAA